MEWLTELDEELRPLGPVPREVAHREGRLHGVVHCWVVSRRAEETRVWFQQRAHEKRDFPDYFDIAVGGHIDYGESVENALRREAREELGITDFQPVLICKYIFESDIEKELVNTFFTIYDGNIIPDNDEVECGRFWSIREIEASLNKDIFTPNFENEYQSILHRLLVSR